MAKTLATLIVLQMLAITPLTAIAADPEASPANEVKERQAPAGRKPAPAESRFTYRIEIDAASLPEGVSLIKDDAADSAGPRIRNAGKIPLEQLTKDGSGRVTGGTKLVDGKAYGFFPNGYPVAGKDHLKGWVEIEGVDSHMIRLDRNPAGIDAGRRPGLPADTPVPPAEEFSQTWSYGGKEIAIKGKIVYSINGEYEKN